MPIVQRAPAKAAKPIIKKLTPQERLRAGGFAPKKDPTDDLTLPDEPKPIEMDLSRYMILLYGREKIGKTTAFASFPDAIFLNTEPGAKGLSIYEFNSDKGGITSWEVFLKAVDLLMNSDRFKTVVIDTADRLYDMCMDYVCKVRNIEYPGRDSSGDEDFGKSWRAVRQEFLEPLVKLQQSKRGVCLTSHVKEDTIKTKNGDKYSAIRPSMGKQAREIIEATVDYFFYAEYMKDKNGATKRVLICQGDETIWAGHRAIEGLPEFPSFLPLERDAYTVIHNAFLGKEPGLDPATLMPAKNSLQTGREFIIKSRTRAAVEKAKA